MLIVQSLFIEISRANRHRGRDKGSVSAASILPFFNSIHKCATVQQPHLNWAKPVFRQGHTFTDQLIHAHVKYLVCMVKKHVNAWKKTESSRSCVFHFFIGILHQMIILFQLRTLKLAAKRWLDLCVDVDLYIQIFIWAEQRIFIGHSHTYLIKIGNRFSDATPKSRLNSNHYIYLENAVFRISNLMRVKW